MPPLWSYGAILHGNRTALLDNIGNVILFLPVGFFLRAIWKRNLWQAVFISFGCSLFIEIGQLVFKLGYFEIDDLLHNTLGALLGFCAFRKGMSQVNQPGIRSVAVVAVTAVVCLTMLSVGRTAFLACRRVQMLSFAAMSDRVDSPNLLILNGESGYVDGSRVYVRYQKDGSIHISGTSEIRSWKLLAEFDLAPGTYTFSGLRGVEEQTVALELEYFDKEKGSFIRLTKDVGPVDADRFTRMEPTQIRAYVGVYPGCDCDVIARPVLYREGD